MRLFIDTNIIVEYIEHRQQYDSVRMILRRNGVRHLCAPFTLRRFNCDSYITFFIAAYFKTVYTNSPTTIIGSEAMIVY